MPKKIDFFNFFLIFLFDQKKILFYFLIFLNVFAQSSKELQEKKKQIDQQIVWIEKQIKNLSKEKDAVLAQLSLLTENIRLREKNIEILQKELKNLEVNIVNQQNKKKLLDQEQKQAQEKYKNLITQAYKDCLQYDALGFVFSAEDFNQALDRYKYVENHVEERKKISLEIQENQEKIDLLIEDLKTRKKQKNNLAKQAENDKKVLEEQKFNLDGLIEKIKTDEKKGLAQIEKEKQQKRQLDFQIRQALEQEKKEAQKKMAENRDQHQHQKTTQLFEAQKGKLIFPLEEGFIAVPFGKRPHKALKYVLEENTGIDILTQPSALAFSIFSGVTTATLYVPGTGYSVIVAHGIYRTVYSNLAEIYVVKDQIVDQAQKIGKVFTQPGSMNAIFHFELWKTDQEKIVQLNPEVWIKKI